MADILIDASDIFTVNNTTYNTTNRYRFVVPPNKVLLLREVSVGISGSFTSNDGRVQAQIGQRIITNQGGAGATTEIPLIQSVSWRYNDSDPSWIFENETITLSFRVGSSSATAQVTITGMLYDRKDYDTHRLRYG